MTMIEIFIAVVILVLGIIPLYQVFMNSSRDAQKNRNRSYAAALAASVIERYRGVTNWSTPDTPYQILASAFPKGEYDSAFNAGGERHVGESKPAFIDQDYLLSPWTTSNVPSGYDQADQNVKEYGDLVKDRYRRLAYFEKKTERLGVLVCTVVWQESGTLPGVFSSETTGLGKINAQYSIGQIIGDPIFPGGKDLSSSSGNAPN